MAPNGPQWPRASSNCYPKNYGYPVDRQADGIIGALKDTDMSHSKNLSYKHRKAIFFEVLGGMIFLSGIALYFQPVDQALFTLFIRFPIVEINFAPGGIMLFGALMWAYGESTRLETGIQLTAEKEGTTEANKRDHRKHAALSVCYLAVLLVIGGVMIQDFLGNGLVLKNIMMFAFVTITVGVKFLLHRVQDS
ncbi:MAG: hypothetical protein QM488_05780 [Rhizobiaceae bacterium]